MKRTPIKGADVLMYYNNEVIAGQRNSTINVTADTLDTTSKDSNGWKTSLSGLREWSTNLETIEFSGDAGKQQAVLTKKAFSGETIDVKIVVPGKFVMSGSAAIISKETTADYSDISKGNYELRGADAPTVNYAPYIDQITYAASKVTIKLTETDAAVVDGKTLKDGITIKNSSGTAQTISSASITSGSIEATMSAALTAGTYSVVLAGGYVKSGDAVQAGELKGEVTVSA